MPSAFNSKQGLISSSSLNKSARMRSPKKSGFCEITIASKLSSPLPTSIIFPHDNSSLSVFVSSRCMWRAVFAFAREFVFFFSVKMAIVWQAGRKQGRSTERGIDGEQPRRLVERHQPYAAIFVSTPSDVERESRLVARHRKYLLSLRNRTIRFLSTKNFHND